MQYKIPKNEVLCTRCCQEENGEVTHIICEKLFTEENKRWILYSVKNNELTKIAQGNNPQILEEKVGYIRKCLI